MVSTRLDERKLRVLSAVVKDYVATAEPVSSRTIARKYRLGVSPATIRNEMSDLEEMGYLEQPHTSAGRVPSDIGYRLYVDRLMETPLLSDHERRLLRDGFLRRAEQIESLMQLTARVLSDMTSYLAVVFGPSRRNARFHSLYMHLISEGRALLVMLTDLGMLESAVVQVPRGTSEEDLRSISEILTERLRGTQIDSLGAAAVKEFDLELKKYKEIFEQLLDVIARWPNQEHETNIYMNGALNILSLPEFHDIEKVRMILSVLQKEDALSTIFAYTEPHSVSIAIGGENKYPEIRECSAVWTTFMSGRKILGTLGVLGPKRMDYARVVTLVDTVREQLVTALGGNAG